MPKSKPQKKDIVQNIKDKLSKSKSVVFTGDTGLNVKTVESLRKGLRENDSEYLVTKKTLLKLADEKLKDEKQIDEISGSIGLTLSYGDEVTGARIVNRFVKENNALVISGGILEKNFILPEVVDRLASLLSKEQLLAKLVGSLKSPITGMVNVFSGNMRNLVGVLNAIKDKKN